MSTPPDQPVAPLSVEELEKLSKKELRKRANEYFYMLDNCGHEQEPAVLAKAQFYLRQLEHRWDSWVSTRDLILEIIVILLIGGEIYMSIRQERQQSANFTEQQKVLSDMLSSSKSTAGTLAALKTTTETMSKNVERNAAAAESSSITARKSLVTSERAYVSCETTTPDEPKVGEKLRAIVSPHNSGKTPAIDFVLISGTVLGRKSESIEDVHKRATSKIVDEKTISKYILGPAQNSYQIVDSRGPLSDAEFSAITNGTALWYVFVEIHYKDTFGRSHTTESCTFYEPSHKAMARCSARNKAD